MIVTRCQMKQGGRYFWPIPYHNSRVLLGNGYFWVKDTHHPLTFAKSTPILLEFALEIHLHHPIFCFSANHAMLMLNFHRT